VSCSCQAPRRRIRRLRNPRENGSGPYELGRVVGHKTAKAAKRAGWLLKPHVDHGDRDLLDYQRDLGRLLRPDEWADFDAGYHEAVLEVSGPDGWSRDERSPYELGQEACRYDVEHARRHGYPLPKNLHDEAPAWEWFRDVHGPYTREESWAFLAGYAEVLNKLRQAGRTPNPRRRSYRG